MADIIKRDGFEALLQKVMKEVTERAPSASTDRSSKGVGNLFKNALKNILSSIFGDIPISLLTCFKDCFLEKFSENQEIKLTIIFSKCGADGLIALTSARHMLVMAQV